MIERTLTITNRAGIHARPAALIAKVANRYVSDVFFLKDAMKINGKSIMGVITLGATYKSKLTMQCDGPDEAEMADAIEHVFANHFEE
ncbi:HPr family phosphocarrier protein [Parasphaerochaeta coccoides]|uniref:Phosphotransferase system, phosphocarrier protein HPr n=1 Tax=Parasphaerochaeta coccoides (strain ATCC BAA-1237 / DSM 17374 / SPN1) TaxID=760011 RepID=F4GJP4_PARC1|nr:HPr family phosphocarrier protein [Parasphaerochaeta coccoides]AEC02791.1 Phosphotransferase system, phosphocarrier protein HPr [Parasphaerochaeta coccoides DSM 17374]